MTNATRFYTDFEPSDPKYRTPENELFFAVVLQALNDMRSLAWVNPDVCEAARDWLLNDEDDFYAVCIFADVDPKRIRNIAQRYDEHLKSGGSVKSISVND